MPQKWLPTSARMSVRSMKRASICMLMSLVRKDIYLWSENGDLPNGPECMTGQFPINRCALHPDRIPPRSSLLLFQRGHAPHVPSASVRSTAASGRGRARRSCVRAFCSSDAMSCRAVLCAHGAFSQRAVPIEDVCPGLTDQTTPARCFSPRSGSNCGQGPRSGSDARPVAESACWAEQQMDPAAAAPPPGGCASRSAPPRRRRWSLEQRCCVRSGTGTGWLDQAPDRGGNRRLPTQRTRATKEGTANKQPWLLVKPVGRCVWLGPLFVPGKTGCWACLAERIKGNAPVLAYLESKRNHTGEAGAHHAATPATLQAAWALTATAVASWVVRGDLPHLEGKVRSLDVLTTESQAHTLTRLPSCSVCGESIVTDLPVRPVVVDSCKKGYTADGGHRIVSPKATLDRYEPPRQPHHRGRSSAWSRAPPPRTAPCTPTSRRPRLSASTGVGQTSAKAFRTGSGGKGVSGPASLAPAGCPAQALERCSGIFHGEEPRRRGRLHRPGGCRPSTPTTACTFSDKQYRERDTVERPRPAPRLRAAALSTWRPSATGRRSGR